LASGRPALCEDVLENAPGDLGLPGPGRPLDFGEVVPHFFRRSSGVERGDGYMLAVPVEKEVP